jgi:hypothetical protein
MKIITTILAAVIIGMLVYFLAKDDRLSKFLSRTGEKEYIKPPDLKLKTGKFGLKESEEADSSAPDPHAVSSDE